jgi:phosphatidylserine/phosphatidylglycerophosphate/cardiolipin synthase-like enzyme
VLVTMSFDPEDPKVAELLAELSAAARRGADVRFIMDAYVYLIHGGIQPGPLFWGAKLPRRMNGPFGRVAAAVAALREGGVKVTVTNLPRRAFTIPVAGRSHIKFALINERVYIGGCNLDWHTKVDEMVAWNDAKTAEWLSELAVGMVKTGSSLDAAGGRDLTHEVNATDTLLVDAGVSGRSLIFEQALQLIDQAEKYVFIACQYFPNDVTAEHLRAAQRRGVKVEIVYNHASRQDFPHNFLHHSVELMERRRMPASFFVQALHRGRPLLHAKLIATEQGVILGSHNFVPVGVRLGTAEIALLSRDADLGVRAVQSLRDQLK